MVINSINMKNHELAKNRTQISPQRSINRGSIKKNKTKQKLALTSVSKQSKTVIRKEELRSVTSNPPIPKVHRTKFIQKDAYSKGDAQPQTRVCPHFNFNFLENCMKDNEAPQAKLSQAYNRIENEFSRQQELNLDIMQGTDRKISTISRNPHSTTSEGVITLQNRQSKRTDRSSSMQRKPNYKLPQKEYSPRTIKKGVQQKQADSLFGQRYRYRKIFSEYHNHHNSSKPIIKKGLNTIQVRNPSITKDSRVPMFAPVIHPQTSNEQSHGRYEIRKEASPQKTNQTLTVSQVVPFPQEHSKFHHQLRFPNYQPKDSFMISGNCNAKRSQRVARPQNQLFRSFKQQSRETGKPFSDEKSHLADKFDLLIDVEKQQQSRKNLKSLTERPVKVSDESFEIFMERKMRQMQEVRLNKVKQGSLAREEANKEQFKLLEELKPKLRVIESVIKGGDSSFENNSIVIPQKSMRRCDSVYELIEKGPYVGVGRFSSVYLCAYKHPRFLFAMKEIFKFTIQMNRLHDQFVREIAIQSQLSHPNLLSLYFVYQDKQKFYMALEYGQTTLLKLIEEQGNIPYQACLKYLRQIIEGLYYLHQKGIIHRDVKPENIVLVNGVCKIADFGWSVQIESLNNSVCGTPCYASPQILNCRQYSFKTDCWSLGILAYQMRFGKVTFKERNELDLDLMNYKLNHEYETGGHRQYVDLIRGLTAERQQQRLSVQEAKSHRVFEQLERSVKMQINDKFNYE